MGLVPTDHQPNAIAAMTPKAARRGLATKFHPDLWSSATLLQRRAAEAAMQRVNAAYDELKGYAT
jgi:DnaJ-class molecular chaperone